MSIWISVFILGVMGQRLFELSLSKRNEKWLKDRGGIERGKRDYQKFIYFHLLFLLITVLEASSHQQENLKPHYFLLVVFLLIQLARYWSMSIQRQFWNIKDIIVPRVVPIKKGLYRYVKHPYSHILLLELFIIPFLIGAYYSAFIFPIIRLGYLLFSVPDKGKPFTNTTPSMKP